MKCDILFFHLHFHGHTTFFFVSFSFAFQNGRSEEQLGKLVQLAVQMWGTLPRTRIGSIRIRDSDESFFRKISNGKSRYSQFIGFHRVLSTNDSDALNTFFM